MLAPIRLTGIVEPDEGGFHAYCPELPGCHTAGDSAEEAWKNLQEAIGLYLEDMRANGETIPTQPTVECRILEVEG
jgi:predicted RNase H-like HicB family nuclease